MYDRLFIFGDSFADNKRLNSHKSGIRNHFVSQEELPKLWSEQLKTKINPREYYNYGKISRGPMYSMNLIRKEKFSKNDLIIVVLSFHNVPSNDLVEINLKNQNLIHSLNAKTLVFHVFYDEIFKHDYTFPLSLYDISNNEILSTMEEISKRRWDRRINHLSWTNHNILCDCVISMLNDKNDYYYDDFKFKFLKLDDAYHSKLVENKLGFIYD
tara:strand:- start:21 stop:659 length:639 start_codon:yes stop_codon:yes gene_type:complete